MRQVNHINTENQPRGMLRRNTSREVDYELPDDIEDLIQHSPLFQVVDRNKSNWFEPYNGHPVPMLDADIRGTARRYLHDNPVYRQQSPMSLQRLRFLRWNHELRRLVTSDKRYTVFAADGIGWVNPYTGDWEANVHAPDRRVTKHTVQQMSSVLNACDAANNGADPLDIAKLKEVARSQFPEADLTPMRVRPQNEDLLRASMVQKKQMETVPEIPDYTFSVHFAGQDAVSGDFYTVLKCSDSRFLILLGDVSGHGMQAALVVACLLKAAKLLVRECDEAVELLARLNDEILPDLVPGQFVTICAAQLDCDSDQVAVVLAGHHPAALINLGEEQVLRSIGQPGMAMGLVSGNLFRNSLRLCRYPLRPGDMFVQCTDGILEAKKDGLEFGWHRFLGACLEHSQLDGQSMVDAVAKNVRRYARSGVEDDLTVMALHRPEPDQNQSNGFRSTFGLPTMRSDSNAD